MPKGPLVHAAKLRRGFDLLMKHRITNFEHMARRISSMPDPVTVHLFFEIPEPVSQADHDILTALSWVPEDDGYVWRFQL